MNASQLRPAGTLALLNGVKAIVYGPPGVGKTPLLNTAPRPLLLACEPGLLSMQGSTIPTWEAYTGPRISEFFQWFFNSHEAKGYDTLGIDSVSELCEIALLAYKQTNRHGQAAYGELLDYVMPLMRALYRMPNKHMYLVAKLERDGGMVLPSFPGKALNKEIPHLFDMILYLSAVAFQGYPEPISCFRTKAAPEIVARDRSGRLAVYEQPHLGQLFAKIMGAQQQ